MNNYDQYSDMEYDNCIAVIGMSGKFPKSENLSIFWDNLVHSRDLITHFSESELVASGIPKEIRQNPYYVRARGILEGIELFDANFFGLSPYEASVMDPQQRLFIEKSWEVLKIANYDAKKSDSVVGVFAAASENSYLSHNLLKNKSFLKNQDEYQTMTLSSAHFLSTRASYLLNLKGPSLTISTGCSSSLVALVMACQSLLRFDCDMALAGGVSVRVPEISGYLYKKGGILSREGKCRPFDRFADGTVSSAGVGVVVLKRLRDAIQDGDSIDVIVRDFCVNNDGSAKIGYTSPSIIEQARCIATAMRNINPETIAYVEAHGTGTHLGDPVEFEALTRAYRHYTEEKNFCALGSVKANMGHSDTAAGVAGFIKVALMLKHHKIPPLLNFQAENPECCFDRSPFYVNSQCIDWLPSSTPRRAGVSSFGIGGTNAHIILEEYNVKNAPFNSSAEKGKIASSILKKEKHWIFPDNDVLFHERRSFLYVPKWNFQEITYSKPIENSNEVWVIFADELGFSENMAKIIKSYGFQVVTVRASIDFNKFDQYSYQINPCIIQHYQELFSHLNEQKLVTSRLIYCWSLIDVRDQYRDYFSIHSIALQLFKDSNHSLQTVLFLTTKSKKVTKDDIVLPSQSILLGPAKIIAQEYSIKSRLVDIDSGCLNKIEVCKNIFYECFVEGEEFFVAYRNGFRFVESYKEYKEGPGEESSFLRHGGVYLITGGLGEVGLALSHYLLDAYNARLIILTKTSNSDHDLRIKKLGKFCNSFDVIYADISNFDELDNVLENISNKITRLDGIFHFAGVKSKRLMADFELEDSRHVMSIKIDGTEVVGLIADRFKARFGMLASSLSTILGGVGMSAYSAANNYLDAYVESKDNLSTTWVSVNFDALDLKQDAVHGSKNLESRLSISECIDQIDYILHISKLPARMLVSSRDLNKQKNEFDHIKRHELIKSFVNEGVQINLKDHLLLLFKECLGVEYLSESDDFYELGGDSLAALRFLSLLESQVALNISLPDFITNRSVSGLLRFIDKSHVKNNNMIRLNKETKDKNLFFIHPVGGSVFCYIEFGKALEGIATCYAIQDPRIDDSEKSFDSLKDMANEYCSLIRSIQPSGPYFIGGYSFGGAVAFEMAHQLISQGEKIDLLIMIDSWASFSQEMKNYQRFLDARERNKVRLMDVSVHNLMQQKNLLLKVQWDRMQLLFDYKPNKIDVKIILAKAGEILPEYSVINNDTNHWGEYSSQPVCVIQINGNHENMLSADRINPLIDIIQKNLFSEKW